jgi:pimeloyl-ACP methyl ester carboxylesterase/2-polyprenyl-6-methoxyphenol hydroxylase-like FAD-dependent oxidoreductase
MVATAPTRRLGERAIVIGASVGGMLAARVLSDAYETVTVIEREALPSGDGNRKAVPQGQHVHALTPRGLRTMEELLPGLTDDLIEDGAMTLGLSDVRAVPVGRTEYVRVGHGIDWIAASRPFIEHHVRSRVRELANVELRERCEVLALAATPDRKRVTGVTLAGAGNGAEEKLEADLVVAATGRAAKVDAWLEQLGYGRPRESVLNIDLRYTSRDYRLRPGAVTDHITFVQPRAGVARGMFLAAQESDRWRLSLTGYGDDRPPADEEGFESQLESVAPPDLLAALRDGEPLGEITAFGIPANRRRHYERMRRFPEGLLPIADAICSFNPVYGQGMTVATLEAVALRRCLKRGEGGLRKRYLRAAAKIVDEAWLAATSTDLALPEVKGKRTLSMRLTNAYLERLKTVGEWDAEVAAAITRLLFMLKGPRHVMRPAIVRRALGLYRRDKYQWPSGPARTPLRRRTLRVGGIATRLREAGPSGASEAVVFVHGNPGSGADFEPLLAAAGQVGRAVAWDAPGFGQADKPEDFEQSVDGHAGFIDRAFDELGIERAHLVLHDFGGPWGLTWAATRPERLASAALLGTGALLDYRWHRMARIWRTPGIGEVSMALTNRIGFRATLRQGNPRGLPGPFADRMYGDFDRRTRRAVLSLYRSVDDVAGDGRRLASALRPLNRPALVIWGRQDPYLPISLAERQREAFPSAEVHALEGSGHWPFVDQAERVEELLVEFLARSFAAAAEPAEAQPA